jgi:uncharacterized protein
MHGIGVIAHEFIRANTAIWRFKPGFDLALAKEDLDELSEAAQEQALHYGWLDEEWRKIIISGDDDRFTNHSDTPNTAWNEALRCVVALTDIHPGEELTLNYLSLGGCLYTGWLPEEDFENENKLGPRSEEFSHRRNGRTAVS